MRSPAGKGRGMIRLSKKSFVYFYAEMGYTLSKTKKAKGGYDV